MYGRSHARGSSREARASVPHPRRGTSRRIPQAHHPCGPPLCPACRKDHAGRTNPRSGALRPPAKKKSKVKATLGAGIAKKENEMPREESKKKVSKKKVSWVTTAML